MSNLQAVWWSSALKLNEIHGFGSARCLHQLLLSASLAVLGISLLRRLRLEARMCKTISVLGWLVGMCFKRCELWSMLSTCSLESGLFRRQAEQMHISKGSGLLASHFMWALQGSCPTGQALSCGTAGPFGEGGTTAATQSTASQQKIYLLIFDGHLSPKCPKTAFTNSTASSS